MAIAGYILAVLITVFIVSGVLSQARELERRRNRVRGFEAKYREWVQLIAGLPADSDFRYLPEHEQDRAVVDERKADELRAWLVARRTTMQRDAESVGRGVMYIAPPPMIGGGFQRHAYFLDLFDDQTNSVGSTRVRLDDLATILHELSEAKDRARVDLRNPWAWVRRSFERVVAFPRYVLVHAGFSKAADSTPARLVTVAWSFVVGASTIGAFVVGLIALLEGG